MSRFRENEEMELIVNPEGLFRLDFDTILDEGKRQEEIHPTNKGEYSKIRTMHFFFDKHVLRLISTDDWVFEAAKEFANSYSMDCFRNLKFGGQEIYRVQRQLHILNARIEDFITRATLEGAIPHSTTIELTKGSDFFSLLNKDMLNTSMQNEAVELYELAKEHEDNQVWATVRAIRDNYEITLPRIMYVVRRVIKTMQSLAHKPSDGNLTSISEYIDWYESHVNETHALYPVLGNLRSYYKVVRNVASHHKGLIWDIESNNVILENADTTLTIHIHEFQQRYRHLIYLCDLGLRGILSSFCGRERGEVSNNLIREYAKTFPEDFPEGISGRVKFYIPKSL